MSVINFINDLKSCEKLDRVFNPWNDYDEIFDVDENAPRNRAHQLEMYLQVRISTVKYILIAEALGYQGGKFSGIAMTSERMILNNHRLVKPTLIFKGTGTRTSNPEMCEKKIQKKKGYAEPTATVVWEAIINSKLSPFEVVLWNIFPFHPYYKITKLENRPVNKGDIKLGKQFVIKFVSLFPKAKIIAIGSPSSESLHDLNIPHIHITHPANGGIYDFRKAIKPVLV